MQHTGMILITGSCGFIGKHVCSRLSAHGKEIIALDRDIPTQSLNNSSHHSIKCDIRDNTALEQIFRHYPIRTVIHLASVLNTASRKNPLTATQVNISGSINILEASRKFNVPKVIYGSSISVYGSKPGNDPSGISEQEPAVPEDVYGAAKRYVEIVGENYRQQFGIQCTSLRIASVVGSGAKNTASPWRRDLFEKLGKTHRMEIRFPYKPEETLPLVHVEDVAEMIECLVEAESILCPLYNTPSEAWKLHELASYIESLDHNIRITFGQSEIRGIPNIINGHKFMTEFGYALPSIRERFRDTAEFQSA